MAIEGSDMATKPTTSSTKPTADRKLFNAFTKSYKLRYVVHAAPNPIRGKGKSTLCGREAIKVSLKNPFDEDADGACKKCVQKLVIERRIHPGWDE